jgi:hypothetical protein
VEAILSTSYREALNDVVMPYDLSELDDSLGESVWLLLKYAGASIKSISAPTMHRK